MDKRFLRTSQIRGDLLQSLFFGSTAPPAFFCPDRRSRSGRAQGRSSLAASCAATARLGLDRPEHGGMLDRIGIAETRWLAATGALRQHWN
jgi:hypothetical protein